MPGRVDEFEHTLPERQRHAVGGDAGACRVHAHRCAVGACHRLLAVDGSPVTPISVLEDGPRLTIAFPYGILAEGVRQQHGPAVEWQWSLRNTMTFGDLDVSLLWRHINGVEREPQDILDQGAGFEGDVATPVGTFYVNADKIPSADYFDLTLRFNVSDHLTFTVAAQNLFNRQPPVVGSSIGSTSYNSGNTFPSTYDALGRRYAASVRLKF